jgi:hypothetical protein
MPSTTIASRRPSATSLARPCICTSERAPCVRRVIAVPFGPGVNPRQRVHWQPSGWRLAPFAEPCRRRPTFRRSPVSLTAVSVRCRRRARPGASRAGVRARGPPRATQASPNTNPPSRPASTSPLRIASATSRSSTRPGRRRPARCTTALLTYTNGRRITRSAVDTAVIARAYRYASLDNPCLCIPRGREEDVDKTGDGEGCSFQPCPWAG